MTRNCKKRKAFIFVELTIGLAVLGIILTCLVLALYGFQTFNHYQLTRQQCTAAAQAQLDSIAVTGNTIGEDDFKRLWPRLTVSIEESDGTDRWKGLKLITAKATAASYNRTVTIELCTYIVPREEN
jgi:hypothetical protein